MFGIYKKKLTMTNNMCFCVIVYCTLFVIAYFITTHNVNVKCRRQHSIQQRSHFVYLEDISQFALPNGIMVTQAPSH